VNNAFKICLLGLLISLAPLAAVRAQPMQGIAAIVNDEVISTYDVDQRTMLVLSSSGVQPTQEIVQRIRAQVLRNLIDEKLQLQESKNFEVEITEEEVDEAIERLARQNNISSAEIARQLGSVGIGIDTLRAQIKAELAWNQLVQGLLSPRVSVADDEVDQILQQLEASSDRPQYLVSEIFLEVNTPDQEQNILQGGMQLIQQMRQGAPFPAVAQQFSNSPSSAQGGDIGWVEDGELPEEINNALKQMQPGQISSPIRTRGGFAIIALRDRRVLGGPDPMAATVDLAQIMIPVLPEADAGSVAKAQQQADAVRDAINGCDTLADAARKADNAVVSELGQVKVAQVQPPFQTVAAALREGEVSTPLRTDAGFHLLVACKREDSGEAPALPSRVQIEDRLYNQELSMLALRYLRDLRRDSTVEMR